MYIEDLNYGDMFMLGNGGDVYMRVDVYPYCLNLDSGMLMIVHEELAIIPVEKYTINRRTK